MSRDLVGEFQKVIEDYENQLREYERSIMEYERQLQLVQQEREGIRELYNKERQRHSFRIPYKIECGECEPWKRYYENEKWLKECRDRENQKLREKMQELKAELYDYINKDDDDRGCC